MLKLSTRVSKCVDFKTFKEICTGPNDVNTLINEDTITKFVGWCQESLHGNILGVFMNDKDVVAIQMVRPFKDGGKQVNGFFLSKDAAKVLCNLIAKVVK